MTTEKVIYFTIILIFITLRLYRFIIIGENIRRQSQRLADSPEIQQIRREKNREQHQRVRDESPNSRHGSRACMILTSMTCIVLCRKCLRASPQYNVRHPLEIHL